MRYRMIPLILIISVWFGCGEEGMGTLELKITNPQDSQITQARVRVDGKNKVSLNLSVESHFIDIDEGKHIIGVDFLDREGKLLHTYAPKIIEIRAGDVTPIEIQISAKSTLDVDEILIEKWILKRVRLEITKDLDIVPLNADGKILKIAGGETVANAWVVEVEDKGGNLIKKFVVSNESTLDSGLLELVEASEEKLVYKGDANGRFTMYLGRREDGKIIFEGIYTTHPPESLRVSLKPSKEEPGKFDMVEFTNPMFSDASGKGDYENYILKGIARIELQGDLWMTQELELYRKR